MTDLSTLQPKKAASSGDESGSQEREFELEDILDYIKTGADLPQSWLWRRLTTRDHYPKS